jgi:hypothetical protein
VTPVGHDWGGLIGLRLAAESASRRRSHACTLIEYVVATAGRVDHGKCALLKALTGMEPDRWEEEERPRRPTGWSRPRAYSSALIVA